MNLSIFKRIQINQGLKSFIKKAFSRDLYVFFNLFVFFLTEVSKK